MNIRLRRHRDTRSPPATSTSTPILTNLDVSGPQPRQTTLREPLWSPTTAGAAMPQPTYIEATTHATHTTSRKAEKGSRPRSCINKKNCRRMRPHTRRNRSTTSKQPYVYTATPFTNHIPSVQHHAQHTQPPRNIPDRCKAFLKALRRKLHLLKFSFLMQFDRFRIWLSHKSKINLSKLSEWLETHILRSKPEPARRPPFPYCPNSCNAATIAASRNGSNGSGGSGGGDGEGKRGGRLRRLSESTVKSLKKACSLNSERDELREEDRRAMRRLDELWRSGDDF
ncbi:hypothetical protein GJ744_006932 [Endocarpon pusillum]|uniref:Uncharacterized protein n=1 Tax=Endocarpon pusillum TaxID=364733 RepID=A0A8H7E7Y8_9EURO|nr:hypothetical protein GJ744_006932 [Endocarpon pusillum]